MEVSSSGGSILVEPASLDAIAARISGAASETSSAHSELAGAAGAAAGCQAAAAASYARLQTMLSGGMALLDECSSALARAVSGAAGAYVTTDDAQMPGVSAGGPGPAGPDR